jgi:hypothetical protein
MPPIEVLHENHDRAEVCREASQHVGDGSEAARGRGHGHDLKLLTAG